MDEERRGNGYGSLLIDKAKEDTRLHDLHI
ncbi:hypothetical protein [Chryseobacterium indoltheticum]|nr:hypothetical protein [Chryseobacterium indoltheticum]